MSFNSSSFDGNGCTAKNIDDDGGDDRCVIVADDNDVELLFLEVIFEISFRFLHFNNRRKKILVIR